ncbi:hypothetical protein FOQG_18428 [Fusarium oxysporum f. sp. raphani 54005]|uniref:BTB domain-containing protein n=2 Tax=Fusarium oxysporum TaxID=5507 RepID=X0BDE5_FUSOX|nr:hypothetical protein FOQG_18428 [Fusarium oxysporum f. sp. raphani 54005]EXL65795.1 hypothetical protein FOPG_17998 [Fusarium oxysporum f. sp. conglutinans race 2 54008]
MAAQVFGSFQSTLKEYIHSMPASASYIDQTSSYYNQDTFSDAIVRCGEQKFKVHKLILSAHSPFFAKMLTGPWKESSENVIKLDDVEPSVVEAILWFMYHFDYSNLHGASTMVFNAQVYSVAEMYGIPALKAHAKNKFRVAINSGWSMDDFPLAITEVYQSTPVADRELRDLAVEVSCQHIDQLLGKEVFCEVLRTIPAFAADLVPFLSGGQEEKYECPSCDYIIRCEFSEEKSYYCPSCGERRSDWASHRV